MEPLQPARHRLFFAVLLLPALPLLACAGSGSATRPPDEGVRLERADWVTTWSDYTERQDEQWGSTYSPAEGAEPLVMERAAFLKWVEGQPNNPYNKALGGLSMSPKNLLETPSLSVRIRDYQTWRVADPQIKEIFLHGNAAKAFWTLDKKPSYPAYRDDPSVEPFSDLHIVGVKEGKAWLDLVLVSGESRTIEIVVAPRDS